MFKKEIRNFDNVQFADSRKKIDDKFNKVHDDLSEAYYDFWKKGESKELVAGGTTYDKADTPEASKELFDKLHALIFDLKDVNFHNENLKQPAKDQIPADKYKDKKDKDGNVVGDKVQEAQNKIDSLKTEGIELDIK